jgi:uncharacterized protein (TIGR02646 family)
VKRIQPLPSATSGLLDYVSHSGDGSNWNGFRDYDDGSAYRELLLALLDVQHGLCGYCEIDLANNDRQVEHIIPRSDPASGAAHTLDHANMVACCKGGTARDFFGPSVLHEDQERFLPTSKASISCGQAKDNVTESRFIDPRDLPSSPSLFRVGDDGTIVVDESACVATGVSVCSLKMTVEILGLNVRRLRRARATRWEALSLAYASHFDDPAVIEQAAREELLPGDDSVLGLC